MRGGEKITAVDSDSQSKKFRQPLTPGKPVVHFADQSRQNRHRRRKNIEIFRNKKEMPVQNQKEENTFRNGKNPEKLGSGNGTICINGVHKSQRESQNYLPN